jgi:hypothetical protein
VSPACRSTQSVRSRLPQTLIEVILMKVVSTGSGSWAIEVDGEVRRGCWNWLDRIKRVVAWENRLSTTFFFCSQFPLLPLFCPSHIVRL